MSTALEQQILEAIRTSPVFRWNWKGRGAAPAGYINGLALVFARVYAKLEDANKAACLMAQKDRDDDSTDALSWYSGRFGNVGYDNTKDGVATLRHLFVLMTGLGMRESSGQYNEGRDETANNETSRTAEAGAWQQSYDSFDGVGETSAAAQAQMALLMNAYKDPSLDGYIGVFKQGVSGNISPNWGQGTGRDFQNLCKTKPAFACEVAAIGLRYLRTHWGPIDRREAELNGYVDQLFETVQTVVDTASQPAVVVTPPAPHPIVTLPPVPATPTKGVLDINDIVRVMHAHNCQIDLSNLINICYVEGMDSIGPDYKTFKPNANRPNAFDALRIVFEGDSFDGMKILGMWQAITHAGAYYEHHLLNPDGAFHIAVGRQSAWRYGIYHHGNYPALLNTDPLWGTRDKNENFKREGPQIHEVVGAHHHWGYDFPHEDVRTAAAGCQVGRFEDGHMEFIRYCRSDARFQAHYDFLWSSTVIPPEWFTG